MIRARESWVLVAVATLVAGCADPGAAGGDGGGGGDGAASDLARPSAEGADLGAPPDGAIAVGPLAFTVVTFNAGTGAKPIGANNGWGDDQATISNDYYGNGLAWRDSVEGTRMFFQMIQPDVVHFQEVFWSGDCPSIPTDARTGFVCETWAAGDPTVAQVLLGAGYQIACTKEKPDSCAAVKKTFGKFQGCTDDVCLDLLTGVRIEDCARPHVGRGVIDLVAGGSLTVVNMHATSGWKLDDMACRKKEIDQIFVDLDGAPAASGARNLVMGDFNADPFRTAIDPSAARLSDFIGPGKAFHYISDEGTSAAATYLGAFIIDHVISDALTGTCRAAGVTAGMAPVLPFAHFDHTPIVCDVTLAP